MDLYIIFLHLGQVDKLTSPSLGSHFSVSISLPVIPKVAGSIPDSGDKNFGDSGPKTMRLLFVKGGDSTPEAALWSKQKNALLELAVSPS
jgi:hypothetical protein